MVLDLFTGAALNRGANGRRGRARANGNSANSSNSRQRSSTATSANFFSRDESLDMDGVPKVTRGDDQSLFEACVAQVQRGLKSSVTSPSMMHTLASYYTKVEPRIEGRPFCVSLSYATFLFHMQMTRICVSDVELYVQLVTNVLSQIRADDQLRHPFVQQVLKDHVFGLPSPTCKGGVHCVVLLSPHQYRAFSVMVTSLIELDVLPLDIVYQFQDKLESFCNATAPLVANRALGLLVQTVSNVRMDEQMTALQYVLRSKPEKMNVDFLMACYERLKRAVVDAANGPSFGRALSIHCSEIFLRFRSPVRREYVERFLYPSLCNRDMRQFLEIPATRAHLQRELLSQCTPGMSTSNPFYMCLCAVIQSCFNDEVDGALETVGLINCRMPHAAYFMSTLAIDSHMSVSMFAKVMIALARGAGLAMTGRNVEDEVAVTITETRTSVYNVLFLFREVVRSCAVVASRRTADMLKALRVAVPPKTIEALGKLSNEAFDGLCDITVDPQLLCAELAMVLHQDHLGEAMDSSVEYFRDVTSLCTYCGAARASSLLCPVNGSVHVTGQTSVSRVLSTLSECAGSAVVKEKLIAYLRNPSMQMEGSVHFLLYHIVAHAGQHRNSLFLAVEPYVRSTLQALVTGDRSGLVASGHKANVLMLHVKLVTLLASSIVPSYLEGILKVFLELRLRSNHDALAVWYMGNYLLRNCKGNLELLPTDPRENNYCVEYPGCAPTCATTADNAQLVLQLLQRAHAFSPEMNKLVGCCVCKLIQDFNVQTPNIVNTLLSPFGFLPVGLPALDTFALPVGAGSTFWNFFLQQIRTSAPARTAFMAALAKSISRRFRVASPVEAVSSYGVESTGHLFAIMMYEAMKRNPPLARVVLYMISHWMKENGAAPGKFVCLVYICVQLVTVIVERGEGPAAVELVAETEQDRQLFDTTVKKTAKMLKLQEPRLAKLAPTVRRTNPEFYYLIRRLQKNVRNTVSVTTGDVFAEDPTLESENAAMDAHMAASGDVPMTMQELQNTADNSVFDDYADSPDNFNRMSGSSAGTASADGEEAGGEAPNLAARSHRSASILVGDHRTLSRMQPLPQPSAGILRHGGVAGSRAPIQQESRESQKSGSSESDGVAYGGDAEGPRARSHSRGVQTSGAQALPFSRSVGTSPMEQHRGIAVTRYGKDGSALLVERSRTQVPSSASPSTSSGEKQRGSTWREPDLFSMMEDGDTTPIDQTDLPTLQATTADGIVLPSGMVLEYLRTHQGMDSLTHELTQLDQDWMAQQVAEYVQRHSLHAEATGAGSAPHLQGSTAAMQEVVMEGRANNYSRPHEDAERLAPSHTVRAAVRMVNTSTTSYNNHNRAAAPVGGPRRSDVVDGERPIRAVSIEPPTVGEDGKRQRVEGGETASPASNFRGMNFFLNQNNSQHVKSALKDVRQGQHFAADTSGDISAEKENTHNNSMVARATPFQPFSSSEGVPPTTPYGQVIIPACFVEQKNETTVRELRQAMGAQNPNDQRLAARGGQKRDRGEGEEGNRPAEGNTANGAWWSEMSAAPVPEYAADPQYSMELF